MKFQTLTAACILSAAVGAAGLLAGSAPGPAPTLPSAREGTFSVDSVHSSLIFRVKHLNISNFYGAFSDVSGEFNLDPAAGSISVTVQTKSVDTRNDKRDAHVRSADFLNADQFPTATFKSTSVKGTTSGKFEVTGDLTICGVTKPVTVPVEQTGSGKGMQGETRAGFEAIFTIKRDDFGISFMPDGLSKDIQLIVSLEGVQK
jgi:polyisoprenoid-binding protein YceI